MCVSGEAGAETGPLERPPEVFLFADVAQAGQTEIEAVRAESLERAPDRLGASDGDDLDALGLEIPSAATRERLDRALVADPLDEHGRARRRRVLVHPRIVTAIRGRPTAVGRATTRHGRNDDEKGQYSQ